MLFSVLLGFGFVRAASKNRHGTCRCPDAYRWHVPSLERTEAAEANEAALPKWTGMEEWLKGRVLELEQMLGCRQFSACCLVSSAQDLV